MSGVLLESEIPEGGFASSLHIYKCWARHKIPRTISSDSCLPIFTVADETSESSLLFSFVSSFLISQETYTILSLSLEVSTLLAYALGCICLFAIISTGTW